METYGSTCVELVGNMSPHRLVVCTCSDVSCKLISVHIRIGYEPLSWAARVQIALDSARGLQYIHEHTVPVYIHRDIKSANILIDKNNRAKVRIVLLYFICLINATPTHSQKKNATPTPHVIILSI